MSPEYIRAKLLSIFDDFIKSDEAKILRNAIAASIIAK